jgi:hypothetical protein
VMQAWKLRGEQRACKPVPKKAKGQDNMIRVRPSYSRFYSRSNMARGTTGTAWLQVSVKKPLDLLSLSRTSSLTHIVLFPQDGVHAGMGPSDPTTGKLANAGTAHPVHGVYIHPGLHHVLHMKVSPTPYTRPNACFLTCQSLE